MLLSVGTSKNTGFLRNFNAQLNNAEVSAKNLCMMLLNEGLLCKETHETVIRFAPPLMIAKKDIDWALNKITKVITSIE